MSVAERREELAGDLERIAEELADLAMDELREAVRAKGPARPAAEKQLTQARRAVEKAIHLLRQSD